ncbi:MAG: hypothetical protein GX029_12380 [Pseudomonadaceae bacterium]|nr:hypothetical protein [Pseudomonadaceae bacterium]
MAPSIFFLHFIGVVIVLLGLTLKEKRKRLGISLAVLGFLIGTAPVWYGHFVGPSPSEMRQIQQMQIQEYMVPDK